jgi:RimJ/RimL family protein N-acetyltransferase
MANPDPTLDFYADPAAFLDAAGPLLTAEPVLGSVIATVTERMVRQGESLRASWAELGLDFEPWWLAVRDERGEVVSAAMRTAPFAPYPCFCLPMPVAAAQGLARALHARGEHLGGSNGALPAAREVLDETARLTGSQVQVKQHTRLFEATTVEVPSAPPGTLRLLRADEAELGLARFRAFGREADEQAGREDGHSGAGEHFTIGDIIDRIGYDGLWAFESPDGEVVHLTGVSLPAYGVSRVGPVYTPRGHRGRGIAGYVVGELTRRGLANRTRMCLFTDQANPVSNKIYERLGYRRVVDMANLVIRH